MTDNLPVEAKDAAEAAVLKALQEGVDDPEELRRLAGLPTLVAVKRTIDKLSIRKEYHRSLDKNQVTMDLIVAGLKDLLDSQSPQIRLSALKALMSSIGLNKFEDVSVGGKDWEDALLRMQKANDPARNNAIDADYDVKVPTPPVEVQDVREAERKLAKEIFGKEHERPDQPGPGQA